MNKKEKENKELSERSFKEKIKGRYFLIPGILALLCVGAVFGLINLNTVSGAEWKNSGEASGEYDWERPESFAGQSPEENYIYALSYEYLTKYAEDNGLEVVDTELVWRISSIAARVIAGLGDMPKEAWKDDETYTTLAERIFQEILSDEYFADFKETDMAFLRELVNCLVQRIMEKAAPSGDNGDEGTTEAEWERIRDIVENSINAGDDHWKRQIEEWVKEHWEALDSYRIYISERLEKLNEELDRVAADSRDGQLAAEQRTDTQERQLWTALESAGAAIDDVRAGLTEEWKNAYMELLKLIDEKDRELEGGINGIGEQWEGTKARMESLEEELQARMESLEEGLLGEKQNTEELVSRTREELSEQILGLSRQWEEDKARMESLEEELRREKQNTESLVSTAKVELLQELKQTHEELLGELKQSRDELLGQVNGKEQELEGRISAIGNQWEEEKTRIDGLEEELSREKQNAEGLVSATKEELSQELKQTGDELLGKLQQTREELLGQVNGKEEELQGKISAIGEQWEERASSLDAQILGLSRQSEEEKTRIDSLLERLGTAEQRLAQNEESIEEILSHSGEEGNTAKFPNGLTMQWGTVVVESHETFPTLSQQVLLKQPFTEGDYVVMVTPYGSQDYLITHSVVRQDINGFELSFHIDCAGGGYGKFTWIAIGY